MAAAGVGEAIDLLEDSSFRLPRCWPIPPPDEFCFQAFEECLDGGIIIAITLAAERWTQAVGLQLRLIVIEAILAAAIRMEKAAFRRLVPLGRGQIVEQGRCTGVIADLPAVMKKLKGRRPFASLTACNFVFMPPLVRPIRRPRFPF